MEQGLDLSMVALLAILVIGFYVLVLRKPRETGTTDERPSSREPVSSGPPVTVNAPPEALEPFVVGISEWGERLVIDARYRRHGCDSGGAPVDETGVYDPDNELLQFWFEVEGPNRDGEPIEYGVFDSRGSRVDRRWLPVDHFPVYYRDRRDPSSPTEQNAVVYCFVGHGGDRPPYPLVANMACCPGTGPRPPVERAPEGEPLGLMRIVYKARDPQGQEAAGGLEMVVHGKPC